MEFFITMIIAAGLAFIPANIAKNKGRNFATWWIYGWLLFIVALIHSLCLKDESVPATSSTVTPVVTPNATPTVTPSETTTALPTAAPVEEETIEITDVKVNTTPEVTVTDTPEVVKKSTSAADLDLLLKYKELLDSGILTQEEFDKKKQELL